MHKRLCDAYRPLMLRGTLVEGSWTRRPTPPPAPRRHHLLLQLAALILGKRPR